MTTPPKKRAAAKRPSGKDTAESTEKKSDSKPESKVSAPAAATAKAAESAKPESVSKEAAAKESAPETAIPPGGDRRGAAVVAPPAAGAARKLAWATLVLGLIVVVGAVTWPKWSHHLVQVFPALAGIADSDAGLDKLVGRVDALEQQTRNLEAEKSDALRHLEEERARFQSELSTLMARLSRVETAVGEAKDLAKAAEAPASTEAAAESLKTLSQRLSELEQGGGVAGLTARVERIEKDRDAGAAAPDPKTLAALEAMGERLKRLEKETDGLDAAADGAAARAVVLAVAQLRDDVRSGLPFATDLESLKALADGRPAISQALEDLTPLAKAGVPTLAVLRSRFAAMSGPIVAAAGTADGDGWIAEAAAKLASLVTVRRVGSSAPDGSVDALVSRVDALLSAGDLAGAVEALKLLKGKPADIVAPWLTAAEQRLTAERAVANLHIHSLSLLAPAKAGG